MSDTRARELWEAWKTLASAPNKTDEQKRQVVKAWQAVLAHRDREPGDPSAWGQI